MNKIILILITLTALLTGCKSEMKQIEKIANSIVTSETAQQEKVNLNKFTQIIKDSKTSYSVGLLYEGLEVPLSSLEEKMDISVIVNITLATGKIYKWHPVDNQNIYLLLRE